MKGAAKHLSTSFSFTKRWPSLEKENSVQDGKRPLFPCIFGFFKHDLIVLSFTMLTGKTALFIHGTARLCCIQKRTTARLLCVVSMLVNVIKIPDKLVIEPQFESLIIEAG